MSRDVSTLPCRVSYREAAPPSSGLRPGGLAIAHALPVQLGLHEWLATFADPVRARAAVDRFASNSYDLVIDGESCRPRQKPTFNRTRRGET